MVYNVGSLFLRHFLFVCSCTTLKIFKNAVRAHFDFVSCRCCRPVVPKVGGTTPLGAVKQKWAVGGR